MSDVNTPRSVAAALEDVERWKSEEESRQRTEQAEVDQEVASLQTAMENLQKQLDALLKFKEELVGKLDSVGSEIHRRTYEALFAALQEQAQALAGRAAKVAEAQKASEASLAEKLEDQEIKALLVEYEQFKNAVLPTLTSLPESYRIVVEAHHNSVRDRLRTQLGKIDTSAVELDEPVLNLDIVAAADAPEGTVEVLMMVLPVVAQVHAEWNERPEDLQTWVAARVLQALYRVCKEIHLPGAQAMYGGHAGLLAVEIELGTGEPERVTSALKEALDLVVAEAPEILGAKVKPEIRIVQVDYLFPPEPPEKGTTDVEATEVPNA